LGSPLGFKFQYGPGSYHRHMQEAERLGMKSQIVHSPGLKFDLDTEEDWYKYLTLDGKLAPRSAVVKTAR
jgi:2-phospho-L-lactate guanylyltransferase (CobY/MobA/RfbA family)